MSPLVDDLRACCFVRLNVYAVTESGVPPVTLRYAVAEQMEKRIRGCHRASGMPRRVPG